MRKKWTYVAVACMLLGTAPVFTGCIDTDEPAGLEDLRQAKSELLRARVAVEEANAYKISAEAALLEAQQAIVAAEARYKEALAQQEEYIALKKQYEAELQNIKNQEEQAYYENLLAQLEAEQEKREREKQIADAQLAVTLEELKTQLLKQQALYDEALKDLALAQNTLTEAQQAHLKPWITAVETAKSAVEQAASGYEIAYADYEDAVKVLEDLEADALAIRRLNRAIEMADRAYKAADNAYQVAVAAQDKDYSTIEAMNARKAEYDAQLKEIEKQLADLEVERTELEMATATEAANVQKLYNAYTAIVGVWDANGNLTADATKEYTLPEIKLENRNIIGLPEAVNYWNIPEDKYLYSAYLQALANGTDADFSQKGLLNWYIKEVNNMTRTPNDDAWTNSELVQYQNLLTQQNELIAPVKEKWTAAVKAFQEGYDIDATQLPGFADLEAAVEDYNDAATSYNNAYKAYNDYYTEVFEPDETLLQIEETAYQKLDEAIRTNQETASASIYAAQQSVELAREAANTAYYTWQKAAAELSLISNPTEAQKGAVDDLRTAWQTAVTAVDRAERDAQAAIAKAESDLTAKNMAAEYEARITISEARQEYLQDKISDDVINQNLSDLWNDVLEAQSALDEEYDKAQTAYMTYANELNIWNWNSGILFDARWYTDDSGNTVPQQVDAAELGAISHENLAAYIEMLSDDLFGIRYGNEVRLVDFTAADMKAEIEKEFMEMYPDEDFVPFDYVRDQLTSYGMVGMAAYYQTVIDIAKAVLDNEEAVAALQKELTDALASVNAAIAAVGTEADTAEKAYNDANTALKAKFAEIDGKIAEATATKYATKPILDAIISAIETYVKQENVNASTLEELKKLLANAVTTAEQTRYDKETELLEARQDLEDYTAGTKEWIEIAKENVDEAAEKLSEKQDELAAANEALLAEIDRISQQTDEVTE